MTREKCFECHTLDGKGGGAGPDLTRVGSRRARGLPCPPKVTRLLLLFRVASQRHFFIDNSARFYNIQYDYPSPQAAVAELADARDLKSLDGQLSCRFDPGQRHQQKRPLSRRSFLFADKWDRTRGDWGKDSPMLRGSTRGGRPLPSPGPSPKKGEGLVDKDNSIEAERVRYPASGTTNKGWHFANLYCIRRSLLLPYRGHKQEQGEIRNPHYFLSSASRIFLSSTVGATGFKMTSASSSRRFFC